MLVVTHKACLDHDPGDRHPEHPARLSAVLQRLEALDGLEWAQAPRAADAAITRVHTPSLSVDLQDLLPQQGRAFVDADTALSPGSLEAAYRAAGAVCLAVDSVLNEQTRRAFCAVRPPGHHAEPDRAMGFCLFNNIAIGARHALDKHGLERVAIVDFDVHHGNGTQAAFESDGRVLFISTHQWPLYPGTGAAHETGVGNIVNLPLSAQTEGSAYRQLFEAEVEPRLRDFAPELILISAGFDGHRQDPLASLSLDTRDYQWITERLVQIAESCCAGRVVSSLEGGYDLGALAASVTAHVEALRAG